LAFRFRGRIFGSIGSLLLFLAFLPVIGPFTAIIGAVFIVLATKYLADAAGDATILRNTMVSAVTMVAGILVTLFFIVPPLSRVLPPGIFQVPGQTAVETPSLFAVISLSLLALGAAWALFVVSALFLRRSFNSLALGLHETKFRTSALLYLVGALTVALLIGFFIMFASFAYQVFAFLSVAEELPVATVREIPPPPPGYPGARLETDITRK
jgi:uncharacterized membrane protein